MEIYAIDIWSRHRDFTSKNYYNEVLEPVNKLQVLLRLLNSKTSKFADRQYEVSKLNLGNRYDLTKDYVTYYSREGSLFSRKQTLLMNHYVPDDFIIQAKLINNANFIDYEFRILPKQAVTMGDINISILNTTTYTVNFNTCIPKTLSHVETLLSELSSIVECYSIDSITDKSTQCELRSFVQQLLISYETT